MYTIYMTIKTIYNPGGYNEFIIEYEVLMALIVQCNVLRMSQVLRILCTWTACVFAL